MKPVLATSDIGRGVNRAQYDQTTLDVSARCSGLAAFSPTGARLVLPAFRRSIVAKELPIVHVSTKETALAIGQPSPYAWMLMCDHPAFAHLDEDDDEKVHCMAVSPDGDYLVVLFTEGPRFWDLRHMAVISDIESCVWTTAMHMLLSSSEFNQHGAPTAISFAGDIVFTASGMLCRTYLGAALRTVLCNSDQTIEPIMTWIAAGDDSDIAGGGRVSAICSLDAGNIVATCTTGGWVELITGARRDQTVRKTWKVWQTQHASSLTAEFQAAMAISQTHLAVGTPTGIWLLDLQTMTHHVHVLPVSATTVTGMVFNKINLLVYITRDGAVHTFNPTDMSDNVLVEKILLYQNSPSSGMASCSLCPIAAEHKLMAAGKEGDSEPGEDDSLKQLFAEFLEYRRQHKINTTQCGKV